MSCMQDTSRRCAEYWFKSRAMEHTSKKERRQLQLHSYHGLVAKLTYHVILLLSMLFLFFRIWHYCCHELHAGRISSLCRILVEARAMKRIKKKKHQCCANHLQDNELTSTLEILTAYKATEINITACARTTSNHLLQRLHPRYPQSGNNFLHCLT